MTIVFLKGGKSVDFMGEGKEYKIPAFRPQIDMSIEGRTHFHIDYIKENKERNIKKGFYCLQGGGIILTEEPYQDLKKAEEALENSVLSKIDSEIKRLDDLREKFTKTKKIIIKEGISHYLIPKDSNSKE